MKQNINSPQALKRSRISVSTATNFCSALCFPARPFFRDATNSPFDTRAQRSRIRSDSEAYLKYAATPFWYPATDDIGPNHVKKFTDRLGTRSDYGPWHDAAAPVRMYLGASCITTAQRLDNHYHDYCRIRLKTIAVSKPVAEKKTPVIFNAPVPERVVRPTVFDKFDKTDHVSHLNSWREKPVTHVDFREPELVVPLRKTIAHQRMLRTTNTHTKLFIRLRNEAAAKQLSALRKSFRNIITPHCGIAKVVAGAAIGVAGLSIARQVRSFVRVVRTATDKVSTVMTKANAGFDHFKSSIPAFASFARDAVAVALLVCAIQTRSVATAAISAAMLLLFPGGGIPKKIVDRYLNKAATTVAPQAAMNIRTTATAAVSCLILTQFLPFGHWRAKCLASTMLHSLGHFDRVIDGWDSFLTFFGRLLEHCITGVGKLFRQDWKVTIVGDPAPDISLHAKTVSAYAKGVRLGEIKTNTATVRAVRAFIRQDHLLRERHRTSRGNMKLINDVSRNLAYLIDAFGPLVTGKTGQRPQPPVVVVVGDPGVGKSLLSSDIADYVCSEVLPEDVKEAIDYDYSGEIYLYPTEEKYANGYCGQTIALFEDLGLGISAIGDKQNDFLKVCSLANPYSKPLDQAAIAGKGNSFFQSELIYCTTNTACIKQAVEKNISSPNALIRRITVPYACTLKEGWSVVREGVAQLDIEQYKRFRIEHPAEQPDAWNFVRWDFAEGRKVQDPVNGPAIPVLNLTDFKKLIVKEIMSNRAFFAASTANRKATNHGVVSSYVLAERAAAAVVVTPQALTSSPTTDEIHPDIATIYSRYAHGSYPIPDSISEVTEDIDPDLDLDIPDIPGHFETLAGLLHATPERRSQITRCMKKVLKEERSHKRYLTKNSSGVLEWTGPDINIGHDLTPEQKLTWFATKLCADREEEEKERVKTPHVYNTVIKACVLIVSCGVVATVVRLLLDGLSTLGSMFSSLLGKSVNVVTFGKYRRDRKYHPQSAEVPTPRVKPYVKHVAMPQGKGCSVVTAPSTREVIVLAVQANTYSVWGNKSCIGFCTFVRDNIMMMPYHYLAHFQDSTCADFTFTSVLTGKVFTMTRSSLTSVVDSLDDTTRVDMPDKDVMFYRVPHMRSHKDVVGYYAPATVTDSRPVKVSLTVRSFLPFIDAPAQVRNDSANNCTHIDNFTYDTVVQTVRRGYEYGIGFKAGDCGSLVYLTNDSKCEQCPMVGMHIGGRKHDSGICNIITRATIEDACGLFCAVKSKVVGTPYEPLVTPHCGTSDHPNMPLVFKTTIPHNVNLRSALRESELFNAWGIMPKHSPNFMPFENSSGEIIVPLEKALRPYATRVEQMDPLEIRDAMRTAMRPLTGLTIDHPREVVSFEEAVTGRAGVFKGIPRGTSCGGHYVIRGMTNKKGIFGKDDYTLDTPLAREVRLNVEAIIADAKESTRQLHVYTEFPKDEMLPATKVLEDGKVRLISACPLDLMVATRMYFLSFSTAVMDTRIDNHIAVGINPYAEWDKLARRLRSKGVDCVAGDFSRFDASEQPQILEEIVHYINEWYDDGPENALIRRVLWLEVINSIHLCGLTSSRTDVLMWAKSLPSGHPLTSIINSIYNLTIFHMAWNRLCPHALRGMFYQYCYIIVLGDDNLQNIAASVVPWWNQTTITQAMAGLHMKYTDEGKLGGVVPLTRPLQDCSFCKRTFRNTPFFVVGPIELDSILWAPYVVRQSAVDPRSILEDTVEMTLGELSLHEPAVWDHWSKKIVTACREVGFIPRRAVERTVYFNWISDYIPPYL